MIPILYDKDETAFISNGLGRLRDCISCAVTEERNGIYECDFEYPVDGANFDLIQCGRIIGVEHDDTNDVQPFDIVSYSKPIDGIVTFHCVHVSYRQNELTVSGKNINSLADAFTLLGTATPSNPFTYETDITSSAYMAAADGIPRTVRQMLGGVEGSILDAYGGEFEWDKFKVILHSNRGEIKDFKIRYGLNMTDYNEETDYQGTYTSVIPYWTSGDVTVKGSKVNSGLISYNGREICIPLDLSEKFETKPTAAQLQTKAAQMITQSNLPDQNIKVDFVRLQDLGEYEQFESLLQCKLCDSIQVVFPRYGMSGTFKIVKAVYDVLLERFEEMELGALSTTLAEALGITEALSNGGGKTAFDLIWNSWYSDVQITNSNQGWRLHSSLSVTVPSGHVYIVQAQTTFASGKPTGIGFHTTTTLSQTTPITFYGDGTNYCAMGTFMLTPGTWYLCDCRATAPSQANAYYVRGLDVTY